MTDKNLGPAVLEILKYKFDMIDEHLSTASFKQILDTDTLLSIKLSRDKALYLTLKTGNLEAGETTLFQVPSKKNGASPSCMGSPKYTNHHSSSNQLNRRQTDQLNVAPYSWTTNFNL
jgi:hypothetical protein